MKKAEFIEQFRHTSYADIIERMFSQQIVRMRQRFDAIDPDDLLAHQAQILMLKNVLHMLGLVVLPNAPVDDDEYPYRGMASSSSEDTRRDD